MSLVLITGARAPAALHLARAVADAGHEVHIADTLSHPLAPTSRRITRYHRLPPPASNPDAFADALATLLATLQPSHVIPTCEEVFHLAWAFETRCLGQTSPTDEAAPTGETATRLVAPPFAVLARAHDKAAFARDAKAFGLAPPDTISLTDESAVHELRNAAPRLVFKPVWSRFAARILIAPEPDALDRIKPSPKDPWVAQTLIAGEELCAYAVADHGRVCALSVYRPAYRAGLGAGIYFEPVADADIARDVQAYVAATGWTGQIAFDFRRDATGRPRVLECNPRATSGVHLFGPGSSLPAALLRGAMAEPTIDSALMIPAAMILYALLPALRHGRIGPWTRDYLKARNAMAWPGDKLPPWAEPRAVWELAAIARRTRTTLIEASTDGIAWDGQPLGRAPADTPERAAAC